MASGWATSHGLDLLLELDQTGGRRTAIIGSLQRAIRDGRLAPGARLPSSRVLAADIGVARGTVAEAYDQMVAEGWLAARQGSGTAVAWTPPRAAGSRRGHAAVGASSATIANVEEPAPPFDFRPGSPDVSMFPRQEWAAAVRRALRELPDAAFRYGDPRGLDVARVALAGYVARTCGVRADPSCIVVTTGFTQALSLLADALIDRGAGGVAMEDPCIPGYRDVVTRVALTRPPAGRRPRRRRSGSTTASRRGRRCGVAHAGPPVPDGRHVGTGSSHRLHRVGASVPALTSSRTTTTVSSGTTASRSGASRPWIPNASSTWARQARAWRRH